MKIGIITTPNEKGQIVIPKNMRDALGINQNVYLNITLAGEGIYIHPVQHIVPKTSSDMSYTELLKKTQGAWGEADPQEIEKEKERRKLELEASKKRKNAW